MDIPSPLPPTPIRKEHMMGWTTLYDRPDDPKAYLARNLTWETENFYAAPLAIRNVGSTYYAATKMQPKPDKKLSNSMKSNYVLASDGSVVFAVVYLTSVKNGEFSYKDMTEDMGPNESKAPPLILNLLSPLTDPLCYAAEWRARCRVYSKRFRPKTGDNIRIKEAWEPYGRDFEKVKYYRSRGVYRSHKNQQLVRLSSHQLAEATLIKDMNPR